MGIFRSESCTDTLISKSLKLVRTMMLILMTVAVSSCATSTVTESKTGGGSEITSEDNSKNEKQSKKHRNRVRIRAALELGSRGQDNHKRNDESQNRHPEVKSKQGNLPSQPETKNKGFWSRFKKRCPHPVCRIFILIDFAGWGFEIFQYHPHKK